MVKNPAATCSHPLHYPVSRIRLLCLASSGGIQPSLSDVAQWHRVTTGFHSRAAAIFIVKFQPLCLITSSFVPWVGTRVWWEVTNMRLKFDVFLTFFRPKACANQPQELGPAWSKAGTSLRQRACRSRRQWQGKRRGICERLRGYAESPLIAQQLPQLEPI